MTKCGCTLDQEWAKAKSTDHIGGYHPMPAIAWLIRYPMDGEVNQEYETTQQWIVWCSLGPQRAKVGRRISLEAMGNLI